MRMVRLLLTGLLLGTVVAVAAPALAAGGAPGAPDAPTNVQGVVSASTLTVTWQAPADNGSPLVSYTLTEQPNGFSETVNAPATSISVDLGASCYTLGASFSLYATNGVGSSTPVTVPLQACGSGLFVNPSPSASPSSSPVPAGPRVVAHNNGGRPDVLTFHDAVADGTTQVAYVNGQRYVCDFTDAVAKIVLPDHNGPKRTKYVVKFDGAKRVLRVR